jgi:hypothetical protein
MSSNDWRLTPASDFDIHCWSFGTVKDIPSLYDPRIFGPEEDNRCNCGKYTGEEYKGIICDCCGVKICPDAAAVRKERVGQLQLACPCEHPVTGASLEFFPIAPVAFRTTADGSPNALGRKYERLVEANRAAAQLLPPKDAYEQYFPAARDFDRTDLTAAMSDILTGPRDDPSHTDSLLALITTALTTADPHLTPLLRAFGYALHAEVTM